MQILRISHFSFPSFRPTDSKSLEVDTICLKKQGENASTALTLTMPLKSHGHLLDIHFNEIWEIRMVPDHLIYDLDRHYQTLNLPSKIDFI